MSSAPTFVYFLVLWPFTVPTLIHTHGYVQIQIKYDKTQKFLPRCCHHIDFGFSYSHF